MRQQNATFGIEETHGILLRETNRRFASSDGYGWTSVYASAQRELPYRNSFNAVPDHLIVWHRNGPVQLAGRGGHRHFSEVVPADAIHLIPGNADLSISLEDELDTLHVYIRRSVIEEVAADMVHGDPRKIEILPKLLPSDRVLQALLSAVYEALDARDPAASMNIDYIALAIAAHLVQHHSNAVPGGKHGTTARSRMLSPAVAKAIDFMQSNIDSSIGLEDIASAVNWSTSHLAREFRSNTGMPPHRYLINLRIAKARELLSTSDLPIAEIAFECGFSHQEHLTRHFKRFSGTTPAAFRRDHRQQKPAVMGALLC